jgi:Transposase.
MKKSRFTESQIVGVLKEGESGVPVVEILRKHGISRNTYFAWKRRYAGGSISDLKLPRVLEAENLKLKRMCTELVLENTAIKEILHRKP